MKHLSYIQVGNQATSMTRFMTSLSYCLHPDFRFRIQTGKPKSK